MTPFAPDGFLLPPLLTPSLWAVKSPTTPLPPARSALGPVGRRSSPAGLLPPLRDFPTAGRTPEAVLRPRPSRVAFGGTRWAASSEASAAPSPQPERDREAASLCPGAGRAAPVPPHPPDRGQTEPTPGSPATAAEAGPGGWVRGGGSDPGSDPRVGRARPRGTVSSSGSGGRQPTPAARRQEEEREAERRTDRVTGARRVRGPVAGRGWAGREGAGRTSRRGARPSGLGS